MQVSDAAVAARPLDNLYDLIVAGGPIMVPIGLCSVISLAYVVERSIRLRRGRLFNKRVARSLVDAIRQRGARQGLEVCDANPHAMTTVIGAGLRRAGAPPLEVEKAVEDAGAREVRRMLSGLRPLVVVGMIAPLLGLLGTVWGMILSFSNIALKEGIGKPELLAAGIAQALITTAAGLIIAIPTQAIYFYFRARIDRFVRDTEDLYSEVHDALTARAPAAAADSVAMPREAELVHAHS